MGLVCRDQGSTAPWRLHDKDALAHSGDDAVAQGEGLPVGHVENGEFGKNRAVLGNSIGESRVFRRIDVSDAGTQNGNGSAASSESRFMGGGIDPAGEARDDGHSGMSELKTEASGGLAAVVGDAARSDHGDGVLIAFQDFSTDE